MPKKSFPKKIEPIATAEAASDTEVKEVKDPDYPLDPEQVRAALYQTIVNAAPLIVSSNIEHAKAGSYLHAKFLFELAGLQAMLPDHAGDEEESLAEILLRELESGTPHPAPTPA